MRMFLSAVAGALLLGSAPLPAFAGQNVHPVAPAAKLSPPLGEATLTSATVGGRGPSYTLVFKRKPTDADQVRVALAPVAGRGPSLTPLFVPSMRTASARQGL
jgi:hypothetical protein